MGHKGVALLRLGSEIGYYQDTGCEVSSSCLSCPLPRCKHDGGPRGPQPGLIQRDASIVAAYYAEESRLHSHIVGAHVVDEVGKRFGVSGRTVHRVVQQARLAKAV